MEDRCVHGLIVTYTGQCPSHPELSEEERKGIEKPIPPRTR